MRVYNPLGFRIKGDKIILPVNKKEIIYHEGSGKLDRVVVHQRNSLGFRGLDPPANFADWLTIITVGGSTTECYDLPEDQTWPHQLEERLQPGFKNTWVNNAGFCGYSTFGNIILVKDFLVKLNPKVLIFLVGINDLGVGEAREYDTRLKTLNFRSLERMLASLANYSELAAASLNLYRYYFPKSVMAVAARDMGEIDLKSYSNLEVTPDRKQAIKQLHREKYLKPFGERIQELIALSRKHGMEPVFLTQPVLYGPGVDDLTGINLAALRVTPDLNGALGWEVLELYNDVVRQRGKAAAVLVIDLAREMPKNSAYYYDLMHYTNAGAALVADIVAAHLTPFLAQKFPAYYQGRARPTPATP
ncbi:MAG: SGNH/GDSL hydrolase family protein [Deltaproteobacteria bacterium]|nr:SGNH/GDSL hydrolase family protein [Deltaproteobacteria bacterium]